MQTLRRILAAEDEMVPEDLAARLGISYYGPVGDPAGVAQSPFFSDQKDRADRVFILITLALVKATADALVVLKQYYQMLPVSF